MAGDALKHYVPGQRYIPVGAYDAFIDTARAFKARQFDGGGTFTNNPHQTGIIKIRNDSGADLEQYHVIQLSTPIFTDPADLIRNVICFVGAAVNAGHFSRYGVALEPIGQDRIGRCVVSGVCIAKIIAANSGYRWASPQDGETILRANNSGSAYILWSEGLVETEQYALMHLAIPGLRGPIAGRLTSTLARGGNATMDAYDVDADGSLADPTGEEYTIVDGRFLADASSPLAVNVQVFGDWYGDVLMLEGFDCDLEDAEEEEE